MFGVLFLIYMFYYITHKFIRDLKQTIRNMDKTYDNLSNTYISYNGSLIDRTTGKLRFIYYDSKHDKWLCGKGIQSINLSQKQREIEYEKLKNSPGQRTAIFYEQEPSNIIYGDGTKRGPRYKDLYTDDLYVVRLDENGHAFYVKVNDDKVIRYTDRYIKNLLEWNAYKKDDEVNAIKEFQNKIDKAKTESFWKLHDPTLIGNSKVNYKG